MGKDAATKELTPETFTGVKYSDTNTCERWIEENGNKTLVYVIRDSKENIIKSVCWKPYKKAWGTINRIGYYGNKNCGNPHIGPYGCPSCDKHYISKLTGIK